MPPKQKRTTKSTTRKKSKNSLTTQKKPKDENSHLNYSITKDAQSGEDYSKITKRPSYSNSKKSAKRTKTESSRAKKDFWDMLDEEIDAIGRELTKPKKKKSLSVKKSKTIKDTNVHSLSISTKSHQRSPYVVRLSEQLESREPVPSPRRVLQKQDQKNSSEWLKEVERLQKRVSTRYKSKVEKIEVDFLGRKSKKTVSRIKKKSNKPFSFKGFQSSILQFAQKALKAILRWLFEFLLSIPLGFLLFFQVLLKLVETGNRLAVTGGRKVSTAASWAIEQAILTAVSLLKGIIIIPIKLVSILFLVVYRVISWFGLFIVSLGNGAYEMAGNYLKPFIRPPRHFYKKVIAVGIVAGLVIIPVKMMSNAPYQIRAFEGKVLGATKDGFAALSGINESISQGRVTAASDSWDIAGAKFSQAKDTIDSLNILVRGAIKLLPQGKDGMRAIQAGEDLAQAGNYITEALAPLIGDGLPDASVIDTITNLSLSLHIALPYISSARTHIESIDEQNLPDAYKEKFLKARALLPDIEDAVRDFNDFADSLVAVLGGEGAKRYAVLFQNNNELRPSGGFIGSLAFIDVRDGVIENIEIPGGGSYDFQGSMSEHVISPRPLWLVNPHWELQDSNWYPDWPTSAAKVAWFIESSGQPSIDGVIAIQATTFEELLRILGPIEFEEYEVVLNADNVLDEIQYEVELGYDKSENKPKEYIAELAPRILEKILASDSGQLVEILSLLKSEINQKNILLYFRDTEINQEFLDRGWEPSIVDSDMDYLSVIHANIGGGKTDGVIKEDWNQVITIDEDGNAIAELTIRRRHNGDPNHLFERFNNVDFTRAYVPSGSELISFTGIKPPPARMFDEPKSFYELDVGLLEIEGNPIVDESSGTRITQEFGKTTFGNWLQVDPGNILTSKIRYKLPFKIKPYDVLNPDISNGYSLLIQKQAGARAIPYTIQLKYPWQWEVSWQKSVGSGVVKVLGPGLTVFEGELSQDSGFAVMFKE